MIIVHEIFICKPGNASKLAKMFKESMAGDKNLSYVMTDMTGQYNRVILVSQYESMDGVSKMFDSFKNPTPEMKESMSKMQGYTDMYLTGSREIFQTW